MAVTASLSPPLQRVEPGGSATFEVHLGNSGASDETLRLQVAGAAAPFSWVAPETVSVRAGGDAVAKVGFHLPKSAMLAVGPVPFQVTVTAGEGGLATADGTVEVTAFAVLSATIDPPESSGRDGGRHQVSVSTRGNAPVDVDLVVKAGDGLRARVDPPTVTVAPDRPATATVEVEPTPGARGPESRHAFTVVATPRVGSPVEVGGAFVQEAVKAGHRMVTSAAVAVVVLAALVFGVTVWPGGSPANKSRASNSDEILASCPGEVHRDIFGIAGLDPKDISKLPDNFSFLRLKPDNCFPARFNPCEPIHYIQNVAAAPPTGAADAREAFRMLGEATGITFVDDGVTDETARAGPYVPERYGRRWAPILIFWDHFGPALTEGRLQIYGNTNAMRVNDVVVSGRLRFNVDAYNDEFARTPVEGGFGPAADSGTGPVGRKNVTWGRVVLHELAHVAGLGHTSDEGSLMYPDAAKQTIRPTMFSSGDLQGLRYLGREAGCIPTPALPA